MFKIKPCAFTTTPFLTHAYDEESILNASLNFFDREGYELALLEQLVYRNEGVQLCSILNHVSAGEEWFDGSLPGVSIDHSALFTRYAYTDSIREQLIRLKSIRPELNKLLCIKPKFGVDISIDYVDENNFIELFHVEKDFLSREMAEETKAKIERIVTGTDWRDFAQYLLAHKADWIHLCSDDESDYKVRLLGLNRAFENIKVYHGN